MVLKAPTERGKQAHKSNQLDVSALVTLLGACAKNKDLPTGVAVHAEVLNRGFLQNNPFVASSLVNMYAKCGALLQANEVFDCLVLRNVVAWSALISGYAQEGHSKEALVCFDHMQFEGLSPNAVTFICILKACGSVRAIDKLEKVHSEIIRQGFLDGDVTLCCALVGMYAKCGAILKAKEVLQGLPARSDVLLNSLIAGCVQGDYNEEALNCFEDMQCECLSPDAITFSCLLKACGSTRSLIWGEKVHSEIVRQDLLAVNAVLGGALVDMYAKCGALSKAKEVLDGLVIRDVASWNVLISAYVQERYGEEALSCFDWMHVEGFLPNAITFACILKACGSIRAVERGENIHSLITIQAFPSNCILGGTLVDMYVKCGAFAKAHKSFEELSARKVISWNALIGGYAQAEHGKEAMECFDRMHHEGLSPNAVTYISILKACGSVGAFLMGKNIHYQILRRGFLRGNILLANALVDMYVKCGELLKAKQVFEELPDRDVVTWSSLIAGYAQGEHNNEMLSCFVEMQYEGVLPNAVTYSYVLKAYGNTGELEKGENIHYEIFKQGMLGETLVLDNALLDMYAKCGALQKAKEVLEGLPVRDVLSWSTLIAGYVQGEQGSEALTCFEQMQCEGLYPDDVTFSCILKACGSIGALYKGEIIHCDVVRQGLIDGNFVVGVALVNMYAKCGALRKAKEVLGGLHSQNEASWNALLAGYAQREYAEEAFNCFEQMQSEGYLPDAATFSCILKVCGSIGALDNGEKIHYEIIRQGLLDGNISLGNALVDMYAKCGAFAKAREVLDGLPIRDAVSWNALITGYSQGECGNEALDCFEQMLHDGLFPDEVTFLSMLTACRQSCLIDKGKRYFIEMNSSYGLIPKLEHRTCMVNLLGCVGSVEIALAVMKNTPFSNSSSMWIALLSVCKRLGNVKLGRFAFEQAALL